MSFFDRQRFIVEQAEAGSLEYQHTRMLAIGFTREHINEILRHRERCASISLQVAKAERELAQRAELHEMALICLQETQNQFKEEHRECVLMNHDLEHREHSLFDIKRQEFDAAVSALRKTGTRLDTLHNEERRAFEAHSQVMTLVNDLKRMLINAEKRLLALGDLNHQQAKLEALTRPVSARILSALNGLYTPAKQPEQDAQEDPEIPSAPLKRKRDVGEAGVAEEQPSQQAVKVLKF